MAKRVFVEPMSLLPDRLGEKSGPSGRTWSYLARDVVGGVHAVLKQAMEQAENRKQPISVWNLQDFGVTKEHGPRVATFPDFQG